MSSDVVTAVDVVSTPALTIAEYFGTASSGDARLSACVATVTNACGEAYQLPEFDEYVMVTAGEVHLIRGGVKSSVAKGQGVLLKAGERVTWSWPQPCQYVIVCLPGEEDSDGWRQPGTEADFSPEVERPEAEKQENTLEPEVGEDPICAIDEIHIAVPELPPPPEVEIGLPPEAAPTTTPGSPRSAASQPSTSTTCSAFEVKTTEWCPPTNTVHLTEPVFAQEPEEEERLKDEGSSTTSTALVVQEIFYVGQWKTSRGAIVDLSEDTITWPSGGSSPVKMDTATTLVAIINDTMYHAEMLQGQLVWDDGDIWSKLEADQLVEEFAKLTARDMVVAAPTKEDDIKGLSPDWFAPITRETTAEESNVTVSIYSHLPDLDKVPLIDLSKTAFSHLADESTHSPLLCKAAATVDSPRIYEPKIEICAGESVVADVGNTDATKKAWARPLPEEMPVPLMRRQATPERVRVTEAAPEEVSIALGPEVVSAAQLLQCFPRNVEEIIPHASPMRRAGSQESCPEVPIDPAPQLKLKDQSPLPSAISCVPTEDQETVTEMNCSASDSSGHATPYSQQNMLNSNNLPDYIPESGDMARASSLSCFDQILDTDGLLRLRNKIEAERQAEERPARYGAKHLNTPIVVVSSELNPWSKTGGLAMVASSYAYEFAVRGHRTMAVSPRYKEYPDCHHIGNAKIWLDGCEHEVKYFHQRQEYGAGKGCDYVFVDHICFHRQAGLYGDPSQGGEYEDNLFRFALLSIAAAEAPLILSIGGSKYGQEVCFIVNDWQTGLLPLYLCYKYKKNKTYEKARSIMVLHNMGYQGKYRKSKYPLDRFLGLPPEAKNSLQGEDMHLGHDCINLLSAGIHHADRVVTVSPAYAREIQTPEGGLGLHAILREKASKGQLAGILNGISDEWSPQTDPHVAVNYGPSDFEEQKARCKAALQRELGLHQDPNLALIGFCGRLCYQKGVHLLCEIIPWLMQDQGNGVNGQVQLVLMGKGDPAYEVGLRNAEASHRGRICGYVGFDPMVEHRMMAGCDLLLMPSQYEPCGLPQMYAQQYGTLPVVHETGGLKDSVKGLWDEHRDKHSATGFLFHGFNVNHLKERLYQALETYHHKRWLFRQMQTNAMQSNFYWPKAIDEYEKQIDGTLESCR